VSTSTTGPSPAGATTRESAEAGPVFNAYAVPSRSGPHVTMQAGVLHAGRFWTTTSRSSFKTRSVRAHGVASTIVPDGERITVVSGTTTALHALRPDALVSDPTAPVRAPGAILRLGVNQIEQVIGYLESAARIPLDWLPHRRVLLVTRPERSLTLQGYDIVGSSGSWSSTESNAGRLARRRDRSRTGGSLPRAAVPRRHRDVVRPDSRAHLGVSTPTGPVALPARWAGGDRFVTSAAALSAVGAEAPGPSVAVFDHSTSRRPDEKMGVMFRGRMVLHDVDGPRAAVRIRTERITTWDGFEAETVTVGR
jgi:hypothetical protein